MKKLENAKGSVEYDASRHIMFFYVKPGTDHELHDSIQKYQLARKLVPEGKVPLVMDPKGIGNYSSDLRSYFAGEDMSSLIDCLAVVVDSVALRITVNFFIYVTKPAYPTKYFGSKEDALEWVEKTRTT